MRQPLIRRQTDFQQRVLGVPEAARHGVAELGVATAANLQLRQLRFLKRGYAQRMRRGSKVLLTAVLTVLIVANVVLLFLLFRPDRALTAQRGDQYPGNGGWPTATSSGSNSRTSAAGDQTSTSPDGSTDPMPSSGPVEAVPVTRLLLATSSTTAWRATIGDCTTPGEIARSTNAGASWKRIVATGSAPIVRLGTERSGLFTIGGTGGNCSVRHLAYASDGAVTASTTSPPNVWFPTPKDRDEINGPSGAQANPCKRHVIGLAPLKPSQALTVCDDGAAKSTHDSGKTWEQIAWIPNTLAVTAGSGRYWLAGTSENCAGVTVQSLAEEDGSLRRGPTRCARDLAVAAGEVAIDVTGGTIWLWSQNRIAISTDDGETWK